MVYKSNNNKLHLVPHASTKKISEWPEVILPFDDMSVEDWQEFSDAIRRNMIQLYDGKAENQVTKQVVLQRLQRALIVFLNSKWSKK